MGIGLLGGGGLGTYFANRGVNDGVEEVAVIAAGLGLDVFGGALAGCGVVGEIEAAGLGGDFGELLDDVEEGRFIPAGELPAVGDRAGKNLFGRPVVGGGGVGRRSDGDRGLRLLLCGRGESGGASEGEGGFYGPGPERSFFPSGL